MRKKSLPQWPPSVVPPPAHTPKVTPQPLAAATSMFLSHNGKTGVSINLSIEQTCLAKTEACAKYCYGLRGPIHMSRARVRYAQNVARLAVLERAPIAELEEEADGLYYGVKFARQDFLRICGVGDLTPGLVRLLNVLAPRHPQLALWVSTRRVDLARNLRFNSNIHIMVSIDSQTPGKRFAEAFEFVKERAPQAYGAFVQQHAEERAPSWVSVVFPVHQGARRAKWATRELADVRTCPATRIDGPQHEGACARCRHCFSAVKRIGGVPTDEQDGKFHSD